MTSFAQDNSGILNARKAQYNRTARIHNASENRIPAEKVNVLSNGSSQYENEYVKKLKSAYARRKKITERKNREFAEENRRTIVDSFRSGPESATYSYEEYRYNERNFPISFAVIAIALTMIAVFLLLNYSQISKYNNSINELKEMKADYEAQIAELDIYLDKKTDLAMIENYADANGMVTSEHLDCSNYICMSDSFKMEKCNDTETEFTIATVMSGVISLFGEALK